MKATSPTGPAKYSLSLTPTPGTSLNFMGQTRSVVQQGTQSPYRKSRLIFLRSEADLA